MVGAPVAGELGETRPESAGAGPGTVASDRFESSVPLDVQTAPWALQSVVIGRTMVTWASESGSMVISQRLLRPSTRLALVTVPLVTFSATSRSVT